MYIYIYKHTYILYICIYVCIHTELVSRCCKATHTHYILIYIYILGKKHLQGCRLIPQMSIRFDLFGRSPSTEDSEEPFREHLVS